MCDEADIDFITADFLRVVDRFQVATGLAETNLSRELLGKGDRLKKLRLGKRELKARTIAEALTYMQKNWPKNSPALWPRTVLRPMRVYGEAKRRIPA